MKRSAIIYVSVIITLCIAGFKPGQGINGKWEGSVESYQGAYNLVYNFKREGNVLTGTVVVPAGDTIAIDKGKIRGNSFTFDVSYNYETYHHNCSLTGDTLTIKIEGSGGDDFTGKFTRAKN